MDESHVKTSCLPTTIMGRPHVEIDYDLLAYLAKIGMRQEQACEPLKISYATFKRRMQDDERFRDSWNGGKFELQESLRLAQIRQALGKGPKAVDMLKFMSAHHLGETERSVVEHANKDGKPLEVAVGRPSEFEGVTIAEATDEELEAMKVLAAARQRIAAEKARDITRDAQEV